MKNYDFEKEIDRIDTILGDLLHRLNILESNHDCEKRHWLVEKKDMEHKMRTIHKFNISRIKEARAILYNMFTSHDQQLANIVDILLNHLSNMEKSIDANL